MANKKTCLQPNILKRNIEIVEKYDKLRASGEKAMQAYELLGREYHLSWDTVAQYVCVTRKLIQGEPNG